MSNFNTNSSRSTSLPPHLKGKEFELVCKHFLENDSCYKTKLKKVWLWNDWPGNWGRDKGIDLIAETHDGEIWAIQAKAYNENYYITKQDIDTFLSESSRKQITYRLLITTGKFGPNAREVLNGQEKQAGSHHLDAESVAYWLKAIRNSHDIAKKEPKAPRRHQIEAIQDVLLGFEKSNKGQVYMACGTGKTLVGLWIAQALKSECTLILVPSIALVSQLFFEWAENSGDSIIDPLFVCSDPTVGKKGSPEDQSTVQPSELGFPVTTNGEEVLAYLANSSTRKKVIFATYHSSPIIAQACNANPSLVFDLVIADEAHRCAGASTSSFATITDKNAIRAKRKLFMTATPKIFSNHVKHKTKESFYEIASMDDEHLFGPIFHKLLFSRAIKQGLLTDYRVFICVASNQIFKEYIEKGALVTFDNHKTNARTLATQLLLADAIKRFDLKKIVTFHSRKKTAQIFVQTFEEGISLLPVEKRPIFSYKATIFGEMYQSERRKILKHFAGLTHEEIGIVSNVKCLSEGIDVPALDGIAFVDPKSSEIDIIQSVGRVMRKCADKKIGTIVIPVFTDSELAYDENDITVLEQSCFRVIWKVVNALRSHDDTLAEELDTIRTELGRQQYTKLPLLKKIIINIPITIGNSFAQALAVKLVQTGSKISLADSHPEIAAQWHPTKNGTLKPTDITAGSGQKVWWKCPKGDDHEWIAQISSRSNGTGCPICNGKVVVHSNCLTTTHPKLAEEWHPTKNGRLTPNDVTAGSGLKVWWKCPTEKGHEWIAPICDRKKYGCPFCSNRFVDIANSLVITHPNLAAEWHPTKNDDLKPTHVTAGSNKKVWWKCSKVDSHEWQAIIRNRTKQKSGCSICTNRVVVLSNCLATTHPEIAAEWHHTKNKLPPYQVTAGSHQKVWWLCRALQHEWQATIRGRVKGNKCSICRKMTNK